MTNTAPSRAVAMLALTAALTALVRVPATAAVATVSPGDELDTISAGSSTRCTLGYTYTTPAGSTYGITAGHCNATPSRYVIDRTTGAVGHFVVTVTDPAEHLADDYALIAFGRNISVPTMYGMPVTGVAGPDPAAPICHDGIRTGVACGQFDGRLAASQYCTTGMPQSIPGDSGGPVWQLNHTFGATIVGIWLGEHIRANGTHFGRFMTMPDVLAGINARIAHADNT